MSATPSASTWRTIVPRLTPIARRVAISPRRSLTVMVSSVADQQHGDDEAHAAEDVGELGEVDQPALGLHHQLGDAVHLQRWKPLAQPRGQAIDGAVVGGLHQEQRARIGGRAPGRAAA